MTSSSLSLSPRTRHLLEDIVLNPSIDNFSILSKVKISPEIKDKLQLFKQAWSNLATAHVKTDHLKTAFRNEQNELIPLLQQSNETSALDNQRVTTQSRG